MLCFNGSGEGIGVKSSTAPTTILENEVDFRKLADGSGVSEELVINWMPARWLTVPRRSSSARCSVVSWRAAWSSSGGMAS